MREARRLRQPPTVDFPADRRDAIRTCARALEDLLARHRGATRARRVLQRLAAACLALSLAWPAGAAHGGTGESLTFGVLAARPKLETAARWQPLADYLARSLHGRTVTLEALDYGQLEAAIESDRLDFVLANPGYYVLLTQRRGISGALATLVDLEGETPVDALGGVILARGDRADIVALKDLAGRRIAFVDVESLGGYQAQARELLRAGIRLPRDARLAPTGMPHDGPVLEVLAGRADAGFVRTGTIEAMAREGKIDRSRLKVLNEQRLPGFPYAASTHLYPQWPLFALAHVPADDARRVSAALLSLEHGGEVARTCGIRGFTIGADYAEVEALLRELQLPPFDAVPAFTAHDVWHRYSWIILALGALGCVIALLAVLLAIGNRRLRAARARAEQDEKQFRTLFESAGDAIFILSPEGTVLNVNRTACERLGYTEHELLGRRISEFQAPGDAATLESRLALLRETGRFEGELTHVRKDGTSVRVEVNARTIAYGGGQAILDIARDVTERQRAEAALRESEERYRTLVENIDQGITLIDAQYRVLTANAAHGRMIKSAPGEIVGRECFRAIHGRDTICPGCPGAVALATGRRASTERTTARPDGTELSVRIQAFPVLDAAGRARGFIELVENTTEAKRAEAERRRLEERVQEAQKMESLGILAGGIAHDFNNLLMGILGNTDLALAKTAPESPVRPFLKAVDRAAQRAADLTNQMLAYSGKGRFIVEPLNLSRVVEEIGSLLSTVISKRAAVRYRLAEGLPAIEADATQIRQIVMNLITNASDALGEAEGTITVTTGATDADATYLGSLLLSDTLPPGPYVFLEVSDTGAGMDNATQARIFDPFFTTKDTGRGLGLAAVLGIVRGHRGAIKVYSEPGHGSTFKVLFPAMPGVGALPDRAATPVAAAPAPPGSRGTILLVDDEPMVRETGRAMLEEGGYAVLTACDGLEGVEVFRQRAGEIAAVVLDMTMPRMGGEEAFREMRRIDERVTVILSSGFNEQDAVNRFTGKGLAGFIQKPYRVQALLEKLRAALAARGARP